jgi:LuxR family transcriptional regulator, maltose regulon positive regulatory protein
MGYLDRLLVASGELDVREASAPEVQDGSRLAASLTDGERKLLQFIAAGLSNQQLADRLSISVNTVKWHLSNIFGKLQIRNRVQAVALARRAGLID